MSTNNLVQVPADVRRELAELELRHEKGGFERTRRALKVSREVLLELLGPEGRVSEKRLAFVRARLVELRSAS